MTQIFDRLFLAVDDSHVALPLDPNVRESVTLQFARNSTVAHPFNAAELAQTDQMWND